MTGFVNMPEGMDGATDAEGASDVPAGGAAAADSPAPPASAEEEAPAADGDPPAGPQPFPTKAAATARTTSRATPTLVGTVNP